MSRLAYTLLIGTSLMLATGCNSAGAASQLNKATDASPEIAAQMRQQGNLTGAADMYNKLLNDDPESAEYAVALASIYRKQGKPDQALAVIQQAQQHAAANPELLVQLGYALIESGQYQQAVDSFDRAMAVRHQYADAYNGKAVAFDHTGNHLIAQQLYRQALGLSPDATNIQNNLALSLIMDGKAAEAVTLLEPVYAQHPDHKTLRQNLAMAYGVSGNSAKAMELNMLSLTKEEAEENQRYYKEFAKRKLKTPKLASKLKPATVAGKKPAIAIEQKPAIAMAPAAEAAPVVQAAPQPITPLVEPAQKAETETKVEEASPAAGGEETAKTDDKTDAEEESIFTFKPIYPGAPRN